MNATSTSHQVAYGVKAEFLNPSACTLHLDFGVKKECVKNLRTPEQAHNALKNHICAIILRYVAHRHKAFTHYNALSPARANAIMRLQTRFGNCQQFSALNLKPKIIGAQTDLLSLLPAPTSRHYKNQSKLLTDLFQFAHSYHHIANP